MKNQSRGIVQSGKYLVGELSCPGVVRSGNCLPEKCPSGNCPGIVYSVALCFFWCLWKKLAVNVIIVNALGNKYVQFKMSGFRKNLVIYIYLLNVHLSIENYFTGQPVWGIRMIARLAGLLCATSFKTVT